jgi:hypothetical protein
MRRPSMSEKTLEDYEDDEMVLVTVGETTLLLKAAGLKGLASKQQELTENLESALYSLHILGPCISTRCDAFDRPVASRFEREILETTYARCVVAGYAIKAWLDWIDA